MRDFITFKHNKFKVEPNEDGAATVATTAIHGATLYEANGKKYLEEADGTLYELVPVENDKEETNNTGEVEVCIEFNCLYNPKDYTKEGDK